MFTILSALIDMLGLVIVVTVCLAGMPLYINARNLKDDEKQAAELLSKFVYDMELPKRVVFQLKSYIAFVKDKA